VMYEYANRFAAAGHQVTVLHSLRRPFKKCVLHYGGSDWYLHAEVPHVPLGFRWIIESIQKL